MEPALWGDIMHLCADNCDTCVSLFPSKRSAKNNYKDELRLIFLKRAASTPNCTIHLPDIHIKWKDWPS